MGNVTITPHTSNVPYEGGTVQLTVVSDLSGILQSSSVQNTLVLASIDRTTFEAGTTVVNMTIFSRALLPVDWNPTYPLTHTLAAQCPDSTAPHGWVTDYANIVQAPAPVKPKGKKK